MRFQDPLILGAGPAGCAAAIALARGGARPLIVERARETGDALCGGFLSWQTLAQLDRLGVRDIGGHRIAQLRVFSGRQSATAPLPALAIGLSRYRLDTAMQRVADQQGARIQRGVAARSFADGVLHCEGQGFMPSSLFLATGKHDLRGLARPRPMGDAPLGLRTRLAPHPALRALIADAIELHLFEGGYAGLLLQEDGSANLCMALRKSRLTKANGDPATLMRELGNAHPVLGERLAFLTADLTTDAIAAVPYGWRATATEPGIFRLGDQAAVIPSLAGEGLRIAIASGAMAAQTYLDDGPDAATAYQVRFASRTRRPVAAAGFLWRQAERPVAVRLALPVLNLFPRLADFAARMTRIGD